MENKLCCIRFLIDTYSTRQNFPKILYHKSYVDYWFWIAHQYNNDRRALLAHFLLLGRTHLVKPVAADRTAGLLMITFSRCPIVLYPLTFPSEENSQWTATAPSQMPFLLLILLLLLVPINNVRKLNRKKYEMLMETLKFLRVWKLQACLSIYLFSVLSPLPYLCLPCRGTVCKCWILCFCDTQISTNRGQHILGTKSRIDYLSWQSLKLQSNIALNL